ncbi:MAG TPA: recombinase family protein [Urbifossiella sp.]|nr:recombinase family protein [Urbifossiella sp.]
MTAFGYLRLTRADERDPRRLTADRAALAYALTTHGYRGYTPGPVLEDAPDQLTRAVAARPQGFRVGRLAEPGDVILTPTAGRLARSVAELRDTLEAWHARGVTGVILDLNLDYARPEARQALALMEAGAHLCRSIARSDVLNNLTADQAAMRNRWGLQVYGKPANRRATVVPAEIELAARCAAWHAGGASCERIALQLTRTREELPERLRKGHRRVWYKRSPFWTEEKVKKMIKSYHVVADLYARGVVKRPRTLKAAEFTFPTAEPTHLPTRSGR